MDAAAVSYPGFRERSWLTFVTVTRRFRGAPAAMIRVVRYEASRKPNLRNAPDARIARLAGRQHGIVTVNAAPRGRSGQARDRAARPLRAAASGRAGRVRGRAHRALARGPVSRDSADRGQRRGAEPSRPALSSARSGAGAPPSSMSLSRRQRRAMPSARIHRTTLHPDDVTVHKGIPCTTIARLVVDLTDHLTSWEITNVIHEAEWRDLFDLDATYAAIERGNGRRIAAARKAVATAPRRLRRRPEQERAQSPHRSRTPQAPRAEAQHRPQRLRGRLPLARG